MTTPDADGSGSIRAFPRQVLTLWRWGSALGNLTLTAVLVLWVWTTPFGWYLGSHTAATIGVAVWASASWEIAWVLPMRYQRSGWLLERHCLTVEHGALIRTVRVYPRSAILFVERRENPVLRRLGLVSVHLHDLAGTHGLGHVTMDDANRIIEFGARAMAHPTPAAHADVPTRCSEAASRDISS